MDSFWINTMGVSVILVDVSRNKEIWFSQVSKVAFNYSVLIKQNLLDHTILRCCSSREQESFGL